MTCRRVPAAGLDISDHGNNSKCTVELMDKIIMFTIGLAQEGTNNSRL